MNTIENHPTAILPAVFARDADRFTQITWKVVKVLSMALTILLPLAWVVQFAGLILKYLTFGLYLILYSLILWMPYGATTWNELVVAPILASTPNSNHSRHCVGPSGPPYPDVCT